MDAVLDRNVTLKTLLVDPVYTFLVWNFNDGSTQVHIATQTKTDLNVNDDVYKDRVTIDKVSGALTMTGMRTADSGDYSITVIKADGSTSTDEINLRVLSESDQPVGAGLVVVLPVDPCCRQKTQLQLVPSSTEPEPPPLS